MVVEFLTSLSPVEAVIALFIGANAVLITTTMTRAIIRRRGRKLVKS